MPKYRVYGNYIFSKVLGEYEAESEQEAIEKAVDNTEYDATLCVYCAQEFVDGDIFDEESCTVDLIEE